MVRVGIIGASGFTGAELLRLCAGHPEFSVEMATADSSAGQAVASMYPSLDATCGDLTYAATTPETIEQAAGLDLVFCALPHGASQHMMDTLLGGSAKVVDLAADFRLANPDIYEQWYAEPHNAPHLLAEVVYGLPELTRTQLHNTRLVAAAGCYPTAATLAMAPLTQAGLTDPSMIIVDAASGVSGAGRPPKPGTTFSAVDANFAAYGLISHRHTPEMEQALQFAANSDATQPQLLFTPHLAPMSRGILATCYLRPKGSLPSSTELNDLYAGRYGSEPFVTVVDTPPATKSTLGANTAHVMATSDPRTGWIVALCAIDNLVKGASGQAIQCANIVTGLPEHTGLPTAGVYP